MKRCFCLLFLCLGCLFSNAQDRINNYITNFHYEMLQGSFQFAVFVDYKPIGWTDADKPSWWRGTNNYYYYYTNHVVPYIKLRFDLENYNGSEFAVTNTLPFTNLADYDSWKCNTTNQAISKVYYTIYGSDDLNKWNKIRNDFVQIYYRPKWIVQNLWLGWITMSGYGTDTVVVGYIDQKPHMFYKVILDGVSSY
jgi:hypothetical protein